MGTPLRQGKEAGRRLFMDIMKNSGAKVAPAGLPCNVSAINLPNVANIGTVVTALQDFHLMLHPMLGV